MKKLYRSEVKNKRKQTLPVLALYEFMKQVVQEGEGRGEHLCGGGGGEGQGQEARGQGRPPPHPTLRNIYLKKQKS